MSTKRTDERSYCPYCSALDVKGAHMMMATGDWVLTCAACKKDSSMNQRVDDKIAGRNIIMRAFPWLDMERISI